MKKRYKCGLIATFGIIILSIIGCPKPVDPNIPIYAEVDCMKGYKPRIGLAHKWIGEVTKDEPGNKRALLDKYDETQLTPQDNISSTDLWTLCREHDNLSYNEDWWVYVIGVKKIDNDVTRFGISKVIGSPDLPNDNSYSGIAISSIYSQCGQYDTEDDVIETVTAHEIFHQFWVNMNYYPDWHCGYPLCIMFWDVNEFKPQDDLCEECKQLLKRNQP